MELLLLDNGSDDGSQTACAAFAGHNPAVRYLPQSRNLGFGGGMNAGVAAARGDWVVLVTSDTLVATVEATVVVAADATATSWLDVTP